MTDNNQTTKRARRLHVTSRRRHLSLARHLVREIRGESEYDPGFLSRAKESKVLEGLAEAAPQLVLQAYFLSRSMLNWNGPEAVHKTELTRFLNKTCEHPSEE